ncbi:hypothetical protein Bbelb_374700 [Branchiostoma belcheri]|nr:hypothetical protein Bbelb_374700 [Branchiostoma belcheri]
MSNSVPTARARTTKLEPLEVMGTVDTGRLDVPRRTGGLNWGRIAGLPLATAAAMTLGCDTIGGWAENKQVHPWWDGSQGRCCRQIAPAPPQSPMGGIEIQARLCGGLATPHVKHS